VTTPIDARASRSRWLLPAVWIGGAGLATAIGLLAVNVVSTQVGDPGVTPLNAGQIQVQLSATTAPVATANATASAALSSPPASATTPATAARPSAAAPVPPTPASAPPPQPSSARSAQPAPAPARTRTFRNAGGTIAVRCNASTAQLLYATPSDGYAVSRREIEGAEVEVRFEGGDGRDPRLRVSCASGVPQGGDN
jgi:cytoskeletal protein RodZ